MEEVAACSAKREENSFSIIVLCFFKVLNFKFKLDRVLLLGLKVKHELVQFHCNTLYYLSIIFALMHHILNYLES